MFAGERGLQGFQLGHEAFAFFFGVSVVASWVSAAAIIAEQAGRGAGHLGGRGGVGDRRGLLLLGQGQKAPLPTYPGRLVPCRRRAVTPAVSLSLAR